MKLQRLFHTKSNTSGNYTCGYLSFTGFDSFCLEDTFNESKIPGETRIPAGIYELKIRKELTPLTIKHRKDYQTAWFKANPNWFHIEVTGIKNYSGVYVHSGNDDSHTLGCLLPAFAFDMTKTDKQTSASLLAVDKFYSMIYPRLLSGERIFITIKDELP